MKKSVILLVMLTGIFFSTKAQKIAAARVPAAVKSAFSKQYPGIPVKWEMEDGKYEASFKHAGSATSVLYDKNGSMTESEVDIKAATLPAAVITYVKEHYKGKIIKEGAKITKADGTVTYEAALAGKDLIFDSNGTFLKEVKE